MAIVYLYMDDFTSYGAVSDAPADQFARLTEPGTYSADPNTDGEGYLDVMVSSGSGKALRTVLNDPYSQRSFTFPEQQDIAHIAGRFRWPAYVGTGTSTVGPGATVDGNTGFGLQVEDGGYLSVFHWSSDASLIRTTIPVVHATSETHIEVAFTFVDAEGDTPAIVWNYSVQAFVEGEAVAFDGDGTFSVTGQSSNEGGFNLAGIVSCGGSAPFLAGDLILATEDETGGTTAIGTLLVGSQLAASDVINTGPWDPSTGTAIYPIFATMPAGEDYAYADAANVPAIIENGLTDIDPRVIYIGGIMTVIRGQKVDGGDAEVVVTAVSPTGSVDGDIRPFTATMTNYVDVHMKDPGTDAEWEVSAVRALKLQTERSE